MFSIKKKSILGISCFLWERLSRITPSSDLPCCSSCLNKQLVESWAPPACERGQNLWCHATLSLVIQRYHQGSARNGTFPSLSKEEWEGGGGGGERERTSQNSGDKALRMSGSCCRVIVLDCSHQRASGAGICVPQGLRTVTSRGPQIHVCTSLQTR